MNKKRIIILGSNSHIAKGLIHNFLLTEDVELYLYTRSSQKVKSFVDTLEKKPSNEIVINEGYEKPIIVKADLLINCTGAGTPKNLNGDYSLWFSITEKFDNLCIEYLQKNPQTLYISMSSGAVYGKDFSAPVEKDFANNIQVNNLNPQNFYSIARLNSEAKHRAYDYLNIVDLRIFSYFSKYADLTDGYFLSDIIQSILNNETLNIDDKNIIRDYIHPKDLFKLILKCMEQEKINTAIDVISKAPIGKKQILEYFKNNYGLKYEIKTDLEFLNSSGTKNIYYSNYNNAFELLGFSPEYTSLESIQEAAKFLIK